MKINEVVVPLDEVGPIDTLRRIGSTVAGAYQGARTGGVRGAWQGAKGGLEQAKSAEDTRLAAKDLFQRWNQEIARHPRNMSPDQATQLIINWTNTALNDRDGTQVPTPQLASTGDARKAYEYLYKRAEEYFRTASTDPSKQPQALGKSQIPAGYAPPASNAEIDYKGYVYDYNPATKAWTNVNTGQTITNPADAAQLNRRYYDLKQAAATGKGNDPDRGKAANRPIVTPSGPKVSVGGSPVNPADPLYAKVMASQNPQKDAAVDLDGKEFGFTVDDNSWHDDITGREITDPSTITRLNQRYYDLKDLSRVGKADDPDDPDVFDPRNTIGANVKPSGSTVTNIKTRQPWNPLGDELDESKIIHEGGNAIPDAEPVNKEDVPGVVEHAKKALPSALVKNLQADIGSAGFKEVPAGDIDLMMEAVDVVNLFNTKDDPKDPVLAGKKALQKYLTDKGYESNVKGRNVHVGIPYTQQATGKKKVAQVDYMVIHEASVVAPWHQHGPRGMYADPDFKGNEIFMLISSIAKHLNLKFDPFAAKLVNRDTGETVGRTRKEVAKILLGPGASENDMNSVKSIIKALENDPDREGKLAQARQDAAKGLMRLPENAPTGTAAWFRQMSDIVR